MSTAINDQDYATRADLARHNPGVWTTLREGQASANLVTRIRSGNVGPIPVAEFEIRSVKIAGKYDIEIRTHVAAQLDLQRIVERLVDKVMEAIQDTLGSPEFREAIRKAASEVVIEETR